MNKRTMMSDQTKQAFRNSFLELYAKNGMTGITVGAITKKAGYNRCTFYNYYNDIYELLDEIENMILEKIHENMELNMVDISVENLNAVFVRFLSFFEIYGDTAYILLSQSGDSGFRRRFREAAIALYHKLFSDKIDDEQIEYLMSYAVSAGIGLIEHWYETGKKYSSEDFLRLAQSLVMKGILGQILY